VRLRPTRNRREGGWMMTVRVCAHRTQLHAVLSALLAVVVLVASGVLSDTRGGAQDVSHARVGCA